jgi:hypothetical protein
VDDPPGETPEGVPTGTDVRAPERVTPDPPAPPEEPVDGPLDRDAEVLPEAPPIGPADDSPGAPPDDAPDVPHTTPRDPPTDVPAGPPPPEVEAPRVKPTLDASVHAHVLEDPLPAPGVVDTAETPLFADTFPRYAHLSDPVGDVASGAQDLPPTARSDPPSFTEALASTPGGGMSGSERHAHVGPAPIPLRRRRAVRRTVAVLLVLLLLGLAALATYLFRSAQGWRDRAESYLDTSLDIGDDLASTRGQLAGSQAELEAVRAQLVTTHQRIVELADEKNQALDDWEITQQLVDYQQRVSDAAGQVALALDQCVQGQQELIGYLQASAEPDGPVYDPAVLAQFETDVEALCQAASEANIALQRELAR